MKNLKDRCNEVIDYFADKTLSFGCVVHAEDMEHRKVTRTSNGHVICGTYYIPISCLESDDYNHKIIGHPVMIGDVLSKIRRQDEDEKTRHRMYKEEIQLISYWRDCGYTRSLNEIFNGETQDSIWINGVAVDQIFKVPEQQALLEFLEKIKPPNQ